MAPKDRKEHSTPSQNITPVGTALECGGGLR